MSVHEMLALYVFIGSLYVIFVVSIRHTCVLYRVLVLFEKWYRMEEHMRAEDGVNRHLVYMECIRM